MTDPPDTPQSGPTPDDGPTLPPLDRVNAPLYLSRWRERRRRAAGIRPEDGPGDEDQPLYLRRFRERRARGPVDDPAAWKGRDLGYLQALSESNRTKEIAAPPQARRPVVNEVYLIRHGETQGYSTEAGLTPLGTWQAHTWGHTLSKRLGDGEEVVIVSAPTNRASETAEHIHRGLLDGLAMFDKDVKVHESRPVGWFRNFRVATPSGHRDVTSAFREYHALVEAYERRASGERPLWLVEIDRFWRTQQAGQDPITYWLTTPLLHFEPPALCVQRFWMGIARLAADHPGARLVIATHSGPIRALAVNALGHDPGEPYNLEHVRVKLLEGGGSAFVGYRNRVQEVHVPPVGEMPVWAFEEEER